jgi:hypothetical protein
MNNKKEKNKNKIINPNKTKELQKDWKGYGKATAYYGLVVLFIFIVSVIYYLFIN